MPDLEYVGRDLLIEMGNCAEAIRRCAALKREDPNSTFVDPMLRMFVNRQREVGALILAAYGIPPEG